LLRGRQAAKDFLFPFFGQPLVKGKNRLYSFRLALWGCRHCFALAVRKTFVRTKVALVVEPPTNVALNDSRHTAVIVNASPLIANPCLREGAYE